MTALGASPPPTLAPEQETLDQELRRLVSEYHAPGANVSVREEAWNLIADCVVENIETIASRLAAHDLSDQLAAAEARIAELERAVEGERERRVKVAEDAFYRTGLGVAVVIRDEIRALPAVAAQEGR